jgi:dynein heavy chain
VAELQADLVVTMVKVEEKRAATDQLLLEMGVERSAAEEQQKIASVEETKANEASAAAASIEAEAAGELAVAKPAMDAAAGAVDCLSKSMLTELKSLSKPPSGVDLVTSCCLIMVEGEFKDHSWGRAQKMMANVDKFKGSLQAFDGRAIAQRVVDKIGPILDQPDFSYEKMIKKSAAAANLANWVINIYTFNRIYVKVKPLMERLAAAGTAKEEAQAQLAAAQAVVADVEARVAKLQETFVQATMEKTAVEAEAAACTARLGLAERLVGGLSSENARWREEVGRLQRGRALLIGDALLAAAFVSYIGAFNAEFRETLWKGVWVADLASRQIPMTPAATIDPLQMLTNDANNAVMMGQGLPEDRMSIENGSIVGSCARWALLIDPQLQGLKWLRRKEEGSELVVTQMGAPQYIKRLQQAISAGTPMLLENLPEELDATLDPILSRAIYKKGKGTFVSLGGEEVEYDSRFRLYMQTKLTNPHYKPEIAAQCTLINFIATERGLQEQLLAKTVNVEQPELEAQKTAMVEQFQRYKVELVGLEDQLLERLANAPEDILSDVPLIEGLEATKKTQTEIEAAVELGHATEIEINTAREVYRRVAVEGAMLFFLLTTLSQLSHMYQFSLDAFTQFFFKALKVAPHGATKEERVSSLQESLRLTIFTWASRGLFEAHKLIFLAQLTFSLVRRGIIEQARVRDEHIDFLVRQKKRIGEDNPLEWLPEVQWQSVCALQAIDEFQKLGGDLVDAEPRFKAWCDLVVPEDEKLPLDYGGLDKTPLLKLLMVSALRPDRVTKALTAFLRQAHTGGERYTECDGALSAGEVMDASIGDSSPTTPLYFILSPGANVVAELDKLSVKHEYAMNVSYHNVSMGQGQDVVAMERLEQAHVDGHWVCLNNVHLMPSWLLVLERTLDAFALEGSHERFRLFCTSDPSNGIPSGLLARSIKLTQAPPAGLKANLKRAFCCFPKDTVEDMDAKTKGILFGLCYFHAVMMERKPFGALGYNMNYPFSLGDLKDSAQCLANYMESMEGSKIPWSDLQYIFGEIMYGGHIVNDFDRLVCRTYLAHFLRDELLDEMGLFPYTEAAKQPFHAPAATSYERYVAHIDKLSDETPAAFGLHPNAEIEFRTREGTTLCGALLDLEQAGGGGGGGGGEDDDGDSPQHAAAAVLADISDTLDDKGFDLLEIKADIGGVEDVGPYQNVFLQECDTLNVLLAEIKRSLAELLLGFSGDLTMSDNMEALQEALFLDRVPASWAKRAWPSMRPLGSWLADLLARIEQLQGWCASPLDIPHVTWLSGLVHPNTFLTAVMQVAAQMNKGNPAWELDKLHVVTTVKGREDELPALSSGAYISGLAMMGARWDDGEGVMPSKPKEMHCEMPVIMCNARPKDAVPGKEYLCPVYKTVQRGPTFVCCAQLRSKSPPGRWILAGVGLVMDVTV